MAEPRPKDGFGNGNSNDYVTVCLSEVRKEMQCPICLGIIRKTRTVMECLHRFCRECIDKSMRLGNNECPACRTHCASRRSLRDDPNFDALIAALYPDLDKYEEEEMTLLEDETRRNRQIQASIAETFKRQSEAVARRRTTAKVKAAAIVRKAHGKFRNVQNRTRGPAQQTRGANNNRGNNNGPTGYGGPLSPQEEERELPQVIPPSQKPPPSNVAVPDDKAAIKEQEVIKEVSKDRAGWRKRRRPRHVEPENSEEKRRATARTTEESPLNEQKPADSSQVVGHRLDASPVHSRGGVVTSWARAGARSHTTRYSLGTGNNSGRNSNRCVRATALLDFVTSSARKENEDEFDIQLHLSPMHSECDDEDGLPPLERPYLCCPPQLTVQLLCKHLVTRLSLVRGGELELLVERISGRVSDQVLPGKVSSLRLNSLARGKNWPPRPTGGKIMEVLESKSTLQYVLSTCWDKSGNLDLLYRLKTGC